MARKKIVLVAGKKSHGPGAHDYERTMRLFKAMLDRSNIARHITVETHEEGWPRDANTFDNADTIVFYSDGRDGDKYSDAPFLKPERLQALAPQIKRGCGFMTMHFSTFATDAEGQTMLEWVGGYFDWQNDKGERQWFSKISQVQLVENVAREHEVMRGLPRQLTLRDEAYWKLRFKPNDSRFSPLLAAVDVHDPENTPHANVVAWAIERKNGGRGLGTSLGHAYRLWEDEQHRKFFLNAIAWTAHVPVPEEGIVAPFLSDDEVKEALSKSD